MFGRFEKQQETKWTLRFLLFLNVIHFCGEIMIFGLKDIFIGKFKSGPAPFPSMLKKSNKREKITNYLHA